MASKKLSHSVESDRRRFKAALEDLSKLEIEWPGLEAFKQSLTERLDECKVAGPHLSLIEAMEPGEKDPPFKHNPYKDTKKGGDDADHVPPRPLTPY